MFSNAFVWIAIFIVIILTLPWILRIAGSVVKVVLSLLGAAVGVLVALAVITWFGYSARFGAWLAYEPNVIETAIGAFILLNAGLAVFSLAVMLYGGVRGMLAEGKATKKEWREYSNQAFSWLLASATFTFLTPIVVTVVLVIYATLAGTYNLFVHVTH